MKSKSLIALALLILIGGSVPLLAWVWHFSTQPISGTAADWAVFGSYVGGTLGPGFSLLSTFGLFWTIHNQKIAENAKSQQVSDEKYLTFASTNMQRAHSVITQGIPPEGTGGVHRDRLSWLTCARHLLTAKSASERLSGASPELQAMLVGETVHWQNKFHEIFTSTGMRHKLANPVYYEGSPSSGIEPLDERSIRVILEFAHAFDTARDPLAAVAKYSAPEIRDMPGTNVGLKSYLVSLREDPGRLKS